ncbi:MAG: hypothetical protein PVF22_05520 [Candidatus Aminicenantes bacterium]|jgi:hypothetical protein
MFTRLLRFQTNIKKIDEVATIFGENIIPLCKHQKGYLGAFFLCDRKTGDCLPMTLWETEKDMIETEESRFFQEQVVKLMSYFASPPIRESYEVIHKD